METTRTDNGRPSRGNRPAPRNDERHALRVRGIAGSQEVRDLMADVQVLLALVAHVADPEIARLKLKLESGMATARHALAVGSEHVQRTAANGLKAGDAYVRERPWQSVGVAAAVGALVGFVVGKR